MGGMSNQVGRRRAFSSSWERERERERRRSRERDLNDQGRCSSGCLATLRAEAPGLWWYFEGPAAALNAQQRCVARQGEGGGKHEQAASRQSWATQGAG